MSSSRKWTWFFVCTILFGLSPIIFVAFNTHVIHVIFGRNDLNNYGLFIFFTQPVAIIILVIGLITKYLSSRIKAWMDK